MDESSTRHKADRTARNHFFRHLLQKQPQRRTTKLVLPAAFAVPAAPQRRYSRRTCRGSRPRGCSNTTHCHSAAAMWPVSSGGATSPRPLHAFPSPSHGRSADRNRWHLPSQKGSAPIRVSSHLSTPSCRPSCAAATLAVAPAEEAGHMAAATRSAIIALQPSDLSRPQVRRLLVHCMLSAPGSCAFPSPSHGGSADRNGWRSAEPKRICTTSCLFTTVHSAHGQAAIQAKLLHCTRRFQHQTLCQCPHPTSRLNVSAPRSALCPRGLP